MTKCDFCEKSSPKGKCRYDSQFVREELLQKSNKTHGRSLKSKQGEKRWKSK